MDYNNKIYVAGHNGMVGSSICRNLVKKGYSNLIFKSSDELNLINQKDVNTFLVKII